jgi:hypothetical protein
MFGILEDLTKAVVGVATLPVSIAADIVTLGGVNTDKDKPYTAETVSDIVQNLKNASTPK